MRKGRGHQEILQKGPCSRVVENFSKHVDRKESKIRGQYSGTVKEI